MSEDWLQPDTTIIKLSEYRESTDPQSPFAILRRVSKTSLARIQIVDEWYKKWQTRLTHLGAEHRHTIYAQKKKRRELMIPPVEHQQHFTRWFKWSSETMMSLIEENVVMVGGAYYILFTNFRENKASMFCPMGQADGEGVAALDGYRHASYFAYAEKNEKPRIFIRNYPTFEKLFVLQDRFPGRISKIVFGENETMLEMKCTDYEHRIIIWYWRKPTMLFSFMSKYSHLHFDHLKAHTMEPIFVTQQTERNRNILQFWHVNFCRSYSFIVTRMATNVDFVVDDMTYSSQGQLFLVSNRGDVYLYDSVTWHFDAIVRWADGAYGDFSEEPSEIFEVTREEKKTKDSWLEIFADDEDEDEGDEEIEEELLFKEEKSIPPKPYPTETDVIVIKKKLEDVLPADDYETILKGDPSDASIRGPGFPFADLENEGLIVRGKLPEKEEEEESVKVDDQGAAPELLKEVTLRKSIEGAREILPSDEYEESVDWELKDEGEVRDSANHRCRIVWFVGGLVICGPDSTIRYYRQTKGAIWKKRWGMKPLDPLVTLRVNSTYDFLVGFTRELGIVEIIPSTNKNRILRYFGGTIRDMAILHPQDSYILTISESPDVCVWKKKSGRLVHQIHLKFPVVQVVTNPKYAYLILKPSHVGSLIIIRLLNPKNPRLIRDLNITREPLSWLTFSHDGEWLITSSLDEQRVFVIKANIGSSFDVFAGQCFESPVMSFCSMVNSEGLIHGLILLREAAGDESLPPPQYVGGKAAQLMRMPGMTIIKRWTSNVFYSRFISGPGAAQVWAIPTGERRQLHRFIIDFSRTGKWTLVASIELSHQLGGYQMQVDDFHMMTWGPDGLIFAYDLSSLVGGSVQANFVICPHHRWDGGVLQAVMDRNCKYVISRGADGVVVCSRIKGLYKCGHSSHPPPVTYVERRAKLPAPEEALKFWETMDDEQKLKMETLMSSVRLQKIKDDMHEIRNLWHEYYEQNQKEDEYNQLELIEFELNKKRNEEMIVQVEKEMASLLTNYFSQIAKNVNWIGKWKAKCDDTMATKSYILKGFVARFFSENYSSRVKTNLALRYVETMEYLLEVDRLFFDMPEPPAPWTIHLLDDEESSEEEEAERDHKVLDATKKRDLIDEAFEDSDEDVKWPEEREFKDLTMNEEEYRGIDISKLSSGSEEEIAAAPEKQQGAEEGEGEEVKAEHGEDGKMEEEERTEESEERSSQEGADEKVEEEEKKDEGGEEGVEEEEEKEVEEEEEKEVEEEGKEKEKDEEEGMEDEAKKELLDEDLKEGEERAEEADEEKTEEEMAETEERGAGGEEEDEKKEEKEEEEKEEGSEGEGSKEERGGESGVKEGEGEEEEEAQPHLEEVAETTEEEEKTAEGEKVRQEAEADYESPFSWSDLSDFGEEQLEQEEAAEEEPLLDVVITKAYSLDKTVDTKEMVLDEDLEKEEEGEVAEEISEADLDDFYYMYGSQSHRYADISDVRTTPYAENGIFMSDMHIVNIQKIINRLEVEFNKRFEEVKHLKHYNLRYIQDKKSALMQNISDLVECCKVKDAPKPPADYGWKPREQPDWIWSVKDEELPVPKFISPSVQALIDAEEERIRRLMVLSETEKFRRQALLDMMDGVIEIRWQDILKKEVVVPEFIQEEKDPAQYNADEIKEKFDYEKKLEELRQKRIHYTEVVKEDNIRLEAEIRDVVRTFDLALHKTYRKRAVMEGCIQSELLKIYRIRAKRQAVSEILEHIGDLKDLLKRFLDIGHEMKNLINSMKEEYFTLANEKSEYQTKITKVENQFFLKVKDMGLTKKQIDNLIYIMKKTPNFRIKGFICPGQIEELAESMLDRFRRRYLSSDYSHYVKDLVLMDDPKHCPPSIGMANWQKLVQSRRERIYYDLKYKAISAYHRQADRSARLGFRLVKQHAVRLRKIRTAIQEHEALLEFTCNKVQFQMYLPDGIVEKTTTGCFEDFRDVIFVDRSIIEQINEKLAEMEKNKFNCQNDYMKYQERVLEAEFDHEELRMKMDLKKNLLRDVQTTMMSFYLKQFLKEYGKTRKEPYDDKVEDDSREKKREKLKDYLAQQCRALEKEKENIKRTKQRLHRENREFKEKVQLVACSNQGMRDEIKDLGHDQREQTRERRFKLISQRTSLAQEIMASHEEILALEKELATAQSKVYPRFDPNKLTYFRTKKDVGVY